MNFKKYFPILLLLSYVSPALSDQTVIPNYDKTRRDIFWQNLYPSGFSFYCGEKFDNRSTTDLNNSLSIEHLYRHIQLFACGSRAQCRSSGNVRFNHMEADLHNIYPAIARINSSRNNLAFGIITGNTPHFLNKIIDGAPASFASCDFERQTDKVEPRNITKGNIARAYFYMIQEYGLQISDEMKDMFKQWNKSDLPNCNELKRNNKIHKIHKIQGTRNKFIDQPQLANTL